MTGRIRLLLPCLARGIAAVALGFALGGLGGVADQLLDGFALLARLPLDLLLGLALGPLGGFLGPDDRPLLFAGLAGLGNGLALGGARNHRRVVGTRPRLEFLERLLSRLGGPCEPLLHVLVLVAWHCILLGDCGLPRPSQRPRR